MDATATLPLVTIVKSWTSWPMEPSKPSNQCENLSRSAAEPTYCSGGTISK
jgi:hypothetical protein